MTFRGRFAFKLLWLMGGGAAVLISGPAIASQEMGAVFDGITATDKGSVGIKIKAYALGYSSPVDPTSGESTSLIVAPVSISRDVDATSPLLMQAGGTGRVFKTIVLTASTTSTNTSPGLPTGTTPTVPLVVTITLTNARVIDWRVTDAKTAVAVGPQEQVTFAAQGITFAHQPLGGDGVPSGTVVTGTVTTKR